MKLILTAFSTMVCWMASAQTQPASSASHSSDEMAVKQAISDETQAFMTRNQPQWENFWVHAPYISWSSERAPSQLMGWEAIKEAFGYNFVAGQSPRAGIAVQRDQYQVNVLDKLATAAFIQTTKTANIRALGKSRGARSGKAGQCLEADLCLFPHATLVTGPFPINLLSTSYTFRFL